MTISRRAKSSTRQVGLDQVSQVARRRTMQSFVHLEQDLEMDPMHHRQPVKFLQHRYYVFVLLGAGDDACTLMPEVPFC